MIAKKGSPLEALLRNNGKFQMSSLHGEYAWFSYLSFILFYKNLWKECVYTITNLVADSIALRLFNVDIVHILTTNRNDS